MATLEHIAAEQAPGWAAAPAEACAQVTNLIRPVLRLEDKDSVPERDEALQTPRTRING